VGEADELGELAKILRYRRKRAFVARDGEAAQAQATEVEIALQMREQHFDLSLLAHGFFESLGCREVSRAPLAVPPDRQRWKARRLAETAPQPGVATSENMERVQVEKAWYGHWRRVGRRHYRRVYRRHYRRVYRRRYYY
jgi:hypothetical protein